MGNSFKLLRIFSVAFKVVAWLFLIMIAVGIVGIVVSKDPQVNTPPVYLNMGMTAVVGFLSFYSAGEIIRVLLIVESNTRKS